MKNQDSLIGDLVYKLKDALDSTDVSSEICDITIKAKQDNLEELIKNNASPEEIDDAKHELTEIQSNADKLADFSSSLRDKLDLTVDVKTSVQVSIADSIVVQQKATNTLMDRASSINIIAPEGISPDHPYSLEIAKSVLEREDKITNLETKLKSVI